jgi:hypothetical protein
MKHSMKHARDDGQEIKHARKQEKKEKSKIRINKKTVFAVLGAVALVLIIVAVVFYFQPIYKFIDSKMTALAGMLFGAGNEENEVAAGEIENENEDNKNENENNTVEEPEVTDEEKLDDENEKEDEKEKTPGTLPTIKLEIYEGPLYSRAGDVCYYRVKANVTGEPLPEISFSKDDSQGSLGTDKAQVNITRDSKHYILTAVAENDSGKTTDTLTLIWNCNAEPEIKGISLSSSTLYVGKQYDVSVDATDMDGDKLSYAWSVSGGSIVDNIANTARWNTPDTPGDYKLSVTVNDGMGNTSESSITAYVGEVIVEEQPPAPSTPPAPTTTTVTVPRVKEEGGYVEDKGETYNGGNLYAGDSDNDKSCMGFVSFDISELKGGTVKSANLVLASATVLGEPLPFFEMLNINVLSWGARPIKQDDYNTDGILVAIYNAPDITCNVSKLQEELQKAINDGKSRFQIRIHFSGPQTNNNGQYDGWKYTQSNVNLNVTITR